MNQVLLYIGLGTLLVFSAVQIYIHAFHKLYPEAKLPMMEYCAHFKYPVENHTIITQDGYKLGFYRIQAQNTQIKSGLPPIYLQHGLLDCSDTWIINDQARAPAFILANKGFDVWMGNSRGNKHSRDHTTLSPEKDPFWQFSWQNMSRYDLPAAFAYIAENTGFSQIDYIGHSQGTAIMFAALAEEDEIVLKHLKHFIALGPVTTVQNQTSPFMNWLSTSSLFWGFVNTFDVQELLTQNWATTQLGTQFCSLAANECRMLLGPLADADPKLDNADRMEVLVGHDPAGTSKMNGLHWRQLLQEGGFNKFDYKDDELNILHYGQVIPPNYDLGNIKVPIYLFAGTSDRLADPTDFHNMLPKFINSPKVWYKEYNAGHCTFLWGLDMSYLNDVLNVLEDKV